MQMLQEFLTVWLKIGIQKSMPNLIKQIRAIKFESKRGTKLWISSVEAENAKKVYVMCEYVKAKNHQEVLGWDVDDLRQTLKVMLMKITLPGYKKETIVRGITDGHALQDSEPAAF